MPSATDREWMRWGEHDPYLGVLGVTTAEIEASADARDRFFASGAAHIEKVLAIAERHLGAVKRGRALDFGCGVGRLLVPLSKQFSEVFGIDVAPAMLAQAERNLAGSSNVRLVQSLDEAPGSFDFVHTFIVLQHIRPQQGMALIAKMVEATAGVFAIHVTLGDTDWRRRALNIARYRLKPLHWAFNVARGRPLTEPRAEMNKYDAGALFEFFRSFSDDPLIVLPMDHSGYAGAMIIGRRSLRTERA